MEPSAKRRLHAFGFAAVNFAFLMGLWVLYTSKFTIGELATGAAASLLATWGAAVVQEHHFAAFAPRPKWMVYFLLMPWFVLRDTAVVFRAALKYATHRKSDGYLVQSEFHAGGDDAHSTARRALAATLTTIAPNSVVVGIDGEHDVVLLHLLAPDDVPWVTRQMGASR